ncbi:MAG: hypothetical protein ACLPX5_08085 [Dissulfurispiraceae bacterium]
MSGSNALSFWAVLYELNRKEMLKKLALFPENLHHYVTIANSIIGAENAKRIKETPASVIESSQEFVSKLLTASGLIPDDQFREVLETLLFETLRDELRFSCSNCGNFCRCVDLENLTVGELFQRRVNGEETVELREEISSQIDEATRKTPYIETDEAWRCEDFKHMYTSSNIGELMGRYADIAATLQKNFDIDYGRVLQKLVSINMLFCEKEAKHAQAGE